VPATDERTAAYRVEHREGDARTVVAIGTRPLDPLAAWLAAQGRGGYLAVVESATGELVIRCPVGPAEPDQPTR
jgi:hypothetical protein